MGVRSCGFLVEKKVTYTKITTPRSFSTAARRRLDGAPRATGRVEQHSQQQGHQEDVGGGGHKLGGGAEGAFHDGDEGAQRVGGGDGQLDGGDLGDELLWGRWEGWSRAKKGKTTVEERHDEDCLFGCAPHAVHSSPRVATFPPCARTESPSSFCLRQESGLIRGDGGERARNGNGPHAVAAWSRSSPSPLFHPPSQRATTRGHGCMSRPCVL